MAGVVAVLGVTFVTSALRTLPRALLTRELEFRRVAMVDSSEGIVSAAATLTLALLGWGYWSLVLGGIIGSVVATAVALKVRPHRLAWPSHLRDIRQHLTFGTHVMGGRVAWYGYSNADFFVVGKVLGTAALGAYNFGWTIATIPVGRITGLLGQVVPGIFSAVQDEPPALRRYLLLLTEGVAFFAFPMAAGLALVAKDLVEVGLGPEWTAAIVPLQVLAAYSGIRSIAALLPFLLQAVGRAGEALRFSLYALVVLPPAFWLGTHWGLAGVGWAWVIGYPVVALPMYRLALQVAECRWRDYVGAIFPAVVATGVMAGAVLAWQAFTPSEWSGVVRLVGQVAVGAVTYAVLAGTIYRKRLLAVVTTIRQGDPRQPPKPQDWHADRLDFVPLSSSPRAVGGFRAEKDAEALRAADHDVHVIAAQVPEAPCPRLVTASGILVERVIAWPSPRQLWVRWRTRARRSAPPAAASTSSSATPSIVPNWKRWIFSLLWLPDDLQGFIYPAYAAARRSHGGRGPDLVITSAPPFSVHLTGLMLAARRVRWIAEFRDPWTDNPWKTAIHRSRLSDKVERWLERETLRLAERVVVASEGIDRILRRKLPPREQERVILIRNGIEALAPALPGPRPITAQRVVHVGSCYGARDPRPFVLGLAEVIRRHGLTPARLQVLMVGKCREYAGGSIEALVRDAGISAFVQFEDWLPHDACQRLVNEADVLLLLAQRQPDQVPNKLYEYLGSRRPILAFVDEEGESARMLREVGGHALVTTGLPADAANGLELALGLAPGRRLPEPATARLEEWTTTAQMRRLVHALQM
ncbi:MAG: oligosaccharide flippase family protein [Gemmatimonadetes bacterium]|nr:oligosaccharide flippase family protein [Gemmatimonadota bacterium]